MTIERKVKYVASDGTEHDSPQRAAERTLSIALEIIATDGGCSPYDQVGDTVDELARNPEALRDALDAYFEALEAHLDVDDSLDPDRIEVGEVAPGVRGFEMEVPSHRGSCDGKHFPPVCADPQCWHRAIHFPGGEVAYKPADRLTVDHPQYCRPFGTRED